jgi:hypothetical protein
VGLLMLISTYTNHKKLGLLKLVYYKTSKPWGLIYEVRIYHRIGKLLNVHKILKEKYIMATLSAAKDIFKNLDEEKIPDFVAFILQSITSTEFEAAIPELSDQKRKHLADIISGWGIDEEIL